MSEEQDQDSKTEEPTGKRLSDAREKGQVPKSQEFQHIFMLSATLALVIAVFPWSFQRLSFDLRPYIEQAHAIPTDGAGLGRVLMGTMLDVLVAMVVPFVLLIIAGVAATVVQIGWLVSGENVFKFDLNRLNPIKNLQNKFSTRNLVEFGKSLVKLVLVFVALVPLLIPLWSSVDYLIGLPLIGVLGETQSQTVRFLFVALLVFVALGGADWAYQRYSFMQKMRMTKQEVKDEFKQAEGDPVIKNRLRQLRMQRARSRMMANVPKADVVVTNPTHYAVALAYKPEEMNAPVVLAMGVDLIAKKIRELAEENDIPLVANPPLARALYATAEIDEEIPAEHYQAVAQVISYVYRLKRKPTP